MKRAPSPRWNYRALLMAALRRPEDAVHDALTACKLESDSAMATAIAANVLYHARQFEPALAHANRSVELDSSLIITRRVRAQVCSHLGDDTRANDDIQRSVMEAGRTPYLLSVLGSTDALAGRRAEAERIVGKLVARRQTEYVAALYIADVCAALADGTASCEWLEHTSEERNGLLCALASPQYDAVRDEPRFKALVRRMNLPE